MFGVIAMNFDKTLKNLKLERDNAIAQECLDAMVKGTVLFNAGIEQERQKLASLYALRLKIATSSETQKFKNDEIVHWQQSIEDLENSNALYIRLNTVRSDQKFFMLFWDRDSESLVAILSLYAKRPLEETELYYSETIEKGFTVSTVKYEKGQMTKHWQRMETPSTYQSGDRKPTQG
jgi:hypothetical protein